MGLFDLFKKKEKSSVAPQPEAVKTTIPETEKQYYQPDSYYTNVTHEGTIFEHRVVTFADRKKTAIPSGRGLYPAEILLLDYCSKGTYPEPKNGYPGFWWFEYGIRDVGAALKALEDRGFIAFASVKESVKGFTVQQLKNLLAENGYPTTGKKADLVTRAAENISEDTLLEAGAKRKYMLTEVGQQELAENAYVPYMHRAHNKTVEGSSFGIEFNVWSINRLLGTGDKSNWKSVVDELERKMNQETEEKNKAFMEDLKKIDPEGYQELRDQDEQLAAVQKARANYEEDNDLDSYIAFWEDIWKNGGLKFEGSGWHFELPELYIKAKRYDDALSFVTRLKRKKPIYADRADACIKKIEKLKIK